MTTTLARDTKAVAYIRSLRLRRERDWARHVYRNWLVGERSENISTMSDRRGEAIRAALLKILEGEK